MVWKPLSVSASAGAHLPPLLISTTLKSDAYTIHLTDLAHIWSESLDRRSIIRRSREENTTIDPSNGDQFSIFLEKIKLGLVGGKDTTLALTISADAGRPSIVLNIIIKLPGGLAPLEWPVRLAAAPQSLLTGQLILPLVRAQHAKTRELEGLKDMLRDKDHVIQKLLDKVEASGTDLGQVFPQVAGKPGRKVERKKAEERVKGMGHFDMEAWRRSLGVEVIQDTAQLIREVFTGASVQPLTVEGSTEELDAEESWWDSIKGITVNLDSGKISTSGFARSSKVKSPAKPALRQEDSIDDDAFQVQATPPHLAPPPQHSQPRPTASDSTDDDDDLDAPSQRSTQRSKIPDSFPASPPPKVPSPKPPKKLDKLGGKKKAPTPEPPPPTEDDDATEDDVSPPRKASTQKRTASPDPEPAKPTSKPKKGLLGKIGGKKEPSPSEPEPEPEPTPVSEEPAPPPAKPKKGKLGKIGGKKKFDIATINYNPDSTSETTLPITDTLAKSKLGVIGGGRKTLPAVEQGASSSKTEENNERGRTPFKVEKEQTPEPRETSLERADRKRAQLKRELEQKAKAPAKKKRKF